MPNIAVPDDPQRVRPRSLDDLRAEPGALVFAADLAALGIARSYDGLKRLPPPLKLPGGKLAWESRTVLRAIGADIETAA